MCCTVVGMAHPRETLVPRRVRFDEHELNTVAIPGCQGASVCVARGAGDTDPMKRAAKCMIHSKRWFSSNGTPGFMRFAMIVYAKQRFTSKGFSSLSM